MPVTKVGVEIPISETDWIRREARPLGLSAQSTPSGIPTASDSTMATITSSIVAGNRSASSSATGR
ncbi:hypothetical protein D3C86_2007750 [compost metagenome]